MKPALPSLAHLPCKEWWLAARKFVSHRRRAMPTAFQLSRPERKRKERLAREMAAEFLAGSSATDIAHQHGVGRNQTITLIHSATTPEQRHRIKCCKQATNQRKIDHRKNGIIFVEPERLPDPIIRPRRTGDSIWHSLVRMSRRFVLAGFEIDEARLLATGVVEKEGAGI